MCRDFATTSCEVHPAGLSTTIKPLSGILLLSCRFNGGLVKSPASIGCRPELEGNSVPCRALRLTDDL
jgi:hypothetical protein